MGGPLSGTSIKILDKDFEPLMETTMFLIGNSQIGSNDASDPEGLYGKLMDLKSLMDYRRLRAGPDRLGYTLRPMPVRDLVCVLHGLSTPIILRPAMEGMIEIIGWYFLEDVMYGETVPGSGMKRTGVYYARGARKATSTRLMHSLTLGWDYLVIERY
ncbi:hypothetical protein CC78DRAFT_350992 [Lojkania enalia]|uniref:Uncharacterized protein n=1 Tax=Lojkania enalia TaxID=147567 RepID=A0A9P4KHH5_9PLEO|nr:hypothetical protein CC78DRAFT_350992 [Didymosphaeria enalia]